jgi:hypothetical protein
MTAIFVEAPGWPHGKSYADTVIRRYRGNHCHNLFSIYSMSIQYASSSIAGRKLDGVTRIDVER